jgi:hypothetical protein
MSGAAAGGPQPTIEEMAASGDPISKEFIELKKKVNLILDVLLALADKVQLQMPASESYQSRLREIESESKKQSGVLDSTDDDYDEQPAVRQEPVLGLRVVKTAGAASKDETQSMGQAVVPTNTNRFIQTPKVGNTSTRLMWESHK